MTSQKHIQDELKSLESSLPFSNNQPFSVPEGYFDGLAATFLAKVKSSKASAEAELGELSPLLAGIPKITPYSVPFSYFEENIETVPNLNQETESPVLSYVGKELPYSVPQDYFENLAEQVLSKISKPTAKVVPLFARTWMRVASAAVIAGALFIAGLQLFSTKNEGLATAGKPDTTQTLVAQNGAATEKEIKQASTKELEEFIETVQVNGKASAEQKIGSEKEVEELLKDVSTNEMESFLSALPVDDDLMITN